jgi:isoleucyl-tRNA synthetase
MRRVQDVADVWFDSGSMPVAQWHYPFENSQLFNNAAEADYISEAVDQTRGWFYALHAVSTLLYERPAFANVISLGHILDARGEKMSKSRGNIVDPWMLIDLYGADAIRWYMYSSAPPFNPRRFTPEQVSEGVRGLMLTIWNTYAFFVTYANADGWLPQGRTVAALTPIDRWILSELQTLVHETGSMLEAFDTFGPTQSIQRFADELSNWYVRRSRRRFWRSGGGDDKEAAYQTLYTCLTTLATVLAPFLPHLSEAMYRNLVSDQSGAAESVHLTSWPEYDPTVVDEQIQRKTRRVLEIARLGRAARSAAGIRIRQPLSELLVQQTAGAYDLHAFEADLREELNVQRISFLNPDDGVVSYGIKPNAAIMGKKYGRLLPMIRSELAGLDKVSATNLGQLVAAGQHVLVEINGEQLRLEPEELTVEPVSPEGYVVSGDEALLVALKTVISPALRREGQARDLVRAIQDGRKRLNLEVVDHVQVLIQTNDEVDAHSLVEGFGDYIRRETLADDIRVGDPATCSLVAEARVDGRSLKVGISKASLLG